MLWSGHFFKRVVTMAEQVLCIGLMSGTSMDGIDAALIATDGDTNIREIGNIDLPYDDRFKLLLQAAQYCIREAEGDEDTASRDFEKFGLRAYLKNRCNMSELAIPAKIEDIRSYLFQQQNTLESITLDHVIAHSTYLHGVAVEKLIEVTQEKIQQDYPNQEIEVVGFHGQTMYHNPEKNKSIILGKGQSLADQLGITVVNDFRACDVAAGGKGAPFAPLYHQALAVRDGKIPAVVINCGGIANVTVIPNANPESVIGFDTGPGNGLIDRFITQFTKGREFIDVDGKHGNAGKVNKEVLEVLHEKAIIKNGENYFDMAPPKALDISDLQLIDELNELSLEDACATLEAFTADTIVESITKLNLHPAPKTFILAGGGWKNPVILRELKERLQAQFGAHIEVMTADEAGWKSQPMEAQIFAHFALRSLQGKPLSMPNTTGVPAPLTGGHAYTPKGKKMTGKLQELLDNNPAVLHGYQDAGRALALV